MSRSPALNNPKYHYVFAIVVIVIYLLVNLIRLRGGVSLSMDSLHYILGAKSLAQGLGYTIPDYSSLSSDMRAVTFWPVGYSAILSFGCVVETCTQEGIEAFARVLNIAMVFATFMLAYVTLRLNHGVVVSTLTSMVVGLVPVYQIVNMYAWSETVFIPLVLAAFYYLRLYLGDDSHKQKLFVAVLFLIGATYVRYIGLSFAIALVLTVLFFYQGSFAKRFMRSVIAGVVYAIGIAPLLISNYLTSGYLSGGDRGKSSSSITNDIPQLFDVFSNEFFFSYSWIAALFLVAYFALVININFEGREEDKKVAASINLPLFWFGLYVGFLLISRELQKIDLDARMMSVAWPMFIYSVSGLLVLGSGKNKILIRRAVVYFLFLFILASGVKANGLLLKNVSKNNEIGFVNGQYYPSMYGAQMEYLRIAVDTAQLTCSEVVITDLDRPIVINYLTGCNKVVELHGNKLDALFDELKGVNGLIILTMKENILSAINHPKLTGKKYAIRDGSGNIMFVLIRVAGAN